MQTSSLIHTIFLTSFLRSTGMGAPAFLLSWSPTAASQHKEKAVVMGQMMAIGGNEAFCPTAAWKSARRMRLQSMCPAGTKPNDNNAVETNEYEDKSAARRRQFAARLLSAFTSGTVTTQFPDAVEMWLEAPQANSQEHSALSSICAHVLRLKRRMEAGEPADSALQGDKAERVKQEVLGVNTGRQISQQQRSTAYGATAAGDCLAIPAEFLSAPFAVPHNPSNKCKLYGDVSRHFKNKFLDDFFKKLFCCISQRCSEHGLAVSLSPYDLFHGHLMLLDDGSGGRLMAIFHIREYPRFDAQKFAYNLGHCQEGSDVSEIDAHRRNILWIDACRDPDERGSRDVCSEPLLVVLNTQKGASLERHLVYPGLEPLGTIFEGDVGSRIADLICIESAHLLSAAAAAQPYAQCSGERNGRSLEGGREKAGDCVSIELIDSSRSISCRYSKIVELGIRDVYTLLLNPLPARLL